MIAVSVEQTEENVEPEPIQEKEEKVPIVNPLPAVKRRSLKNISDLEKRYAKFNTCRSFTAAVYRKHINLDLISKRATNGLLVFRPYEKKSGSVSNTSSFISQILIRLAERGNKGLGTPPTGPAPPLLIRSLPLEHDLENKTILTPEIQVRRGPGRPYGSLTVKRGKRKYKDLSSGHSTIKKRVSKRVKQKEIISSDDDFDVSTLDKPTFEVPKPTFELRNDNVDDIMDLFNINSLIQSRENSIVFYK